MNRMNQETAITRSFHTVPCRSGRLLARTSFPSVLVEPRTVYVWLPPGYGEGSSRRYPVIYAHDGQNLFTPETSFAGVDWGVDDAMARLALHGVASAMVVGIWNTPRRYNEYDPEQVFHHCLCPEEQVAYSREHGIPASDNYLRFIAEELKPFIDATFSSNPGPGSTFMIGSSMGGLISVYALCLYPELFGGIASLSTHWPACGGMMVEYCGRHLPPPGNHKLYFDYGTETDDAPYEPYQLRMDNLLQTAGYTREREWLTLKFAGEEHSERSWRRRVDIPLRFLLS